MSVPAQAKQSSSAETAVSSRILTIERAALPPEYVQRTDVAREISHSHLERLLQRFGVRAVSTRLRDLRHAWSFFLEAREYGAIITLGDLTGLTVATLQRIFRRRTVHVMYDCLWYGGNFLKRAWMRFCIRATDRCVVWASIECERYASAYRVPKDRFLFVPHHHTTKNYQFAIEDGGYLFTGGNWSRDYHLFLEAVRDLDFPCVLATNRLELLDGMQIPQHVRVVSATPAEFRELLARSRFVVLPMQADLLHAGGQQTFLNAMMMGKPVVLTDPEGGRDYIIHGETGMLAPYPNIEALKSAIEFLAKHPEECARMGQRAREAALPLTTLKCNTLIWQEAAALLHKRDVLPNRSNRNMDHRS